tara:strand:+ start:4941 stop:5336 length:396 start_codon:yes stop_codon:yes gene_type:complete
MSTKVGGAKKKSTITNSKKSRKAVMGGHVNQYALFQPSGEQSNGMLQTQSQSIPVPSLEFQDTVSLIPEAQLIANQEGAGKKRKKTKKTKRKPGPYALFVKKNYAKVAKDHPKWKATDCIKEIAKMWKTKK